MEFIIQTAILSGDNTKELRLFSTYDISAQNEIILTQHLCTLMNKFQYHWDGWVFLNSHRPCETIFSLEAVYVEEELVAVPALDRLERVLEECGLTITMVDAAQLRFFDVYCVQKSTSTDSLGWKTKGAPA